MKTLGSFSVYTALYISLIGVALSYVAGRTGSRRFLRASRFALYASFGALAVASSILLHAFLTHDFSIQYVAEFSSRKMPLFYLVGAFWGGQAGSLLFWASVVGFFSAACGYLNRHEHQEFMPWVHFTCLSVLAGLLAIMAFASNPFEGYSVIADPTTGEGLNPLLQTPKMVIHPPCLLTGLASMTVPFSFAIAALITGDLSARWVKAARKWILIPWLFLSVGNILGGMWAYEELGWGGYWAWDPVENAAFMPWLVATALVHSLMIQERRGMLKRWNVGLMIGTFLLTVFGTYITRSGLIDSIHTFAQSDIGNYFLAFLIGVTIFSVGLFLWRWPEMEAEETLDSAASREAAFMFNNWLFVAMTFVVMFGTMWPKVKTWISGQKVSIGPPWYNDWMIPLGLITLLLMGVGTVIAWRKATIENFRRDFVQPLAATVVLTPALVGGYWWLRGADLGAAPTPLNASYAILTIAGCIFVSTAMLQEFWRGVAARRRAHGENPAVALYRLVGKQRRRYGGYVVHFGIVFAFVAFAGNALKIDKDVSMKVGESTELGDYRMRFEGFDRSSDEQKMLVTANMSVFREGEEAFDIHAGKAMFFASPEKQRAGKRFKMGTSEIDIRSGPLEDVYVALVSFNPNNQRAAFKMFVNPFTWWFWAGGVILVLGALLGMWPSREGFERLKPTALQFGRLGVGAVLAAVCVAPLALWQVESHTGWGSALRYDELVEAPETPPDGGNPPETATEGDGAPPS